MQKLKKYFLDDILEHMPNDPFEKMKLEILFNLLIVWIPASLLSIIPLILNKYWFMLCSPLITTIGSFVALFLLKKTKSYKNSGYIYVATSIIGVSIMHLIGGGNLRGIDVLWILLAVIVAFVLLGKKLGLYAFLFNGFLLVWSTLIYIDQIPAHKLSLFVHEQELFEQPSIINALVPLLAIGYTLYAYLAVQEKAQELLSLQKVDINQKREKIEIAQKETEDSIYYAQRIQNAILPSSKLRREQVNKSFILYKPKDIVSGDFYWTQSNGDIQFFAVADCTGHGVPGAMISVVCMNSLNRAVKEFKLTNPAEILNQTRSLIISKFNNSSNNIKDGMDISLCALNTKTKQLSWSGANIPLWIIRSNSKAIEITKPNNQPVGEHSFKSSFISHSFQLAKNDMVYITTNGFSDQIGGNLKQEYKTDQLKNKLIELSERPLTSQKQELELEFENWKGELDQVDDVSLMGVKI